ncbi:hypothetical protein [Tistrella mobilis]|uniref:Uncharacterized protein n=1 Tax=Tistrella mobilis (strain KA081020-065) TaxID=1110502 RepID=I3TN95_TISMK|nr:hypothetical protein [Tistrella mobilis]AFK54233.1 hypothetical protein TMO_2395 [Tistrella mobilis KA081020-065]
MTQARHTTYKDELLKVCDDLKAATAAMHAAAGGAPSNQQLLISGMAWLIRDTERSLRELTQGDEERAVHGPYDAIAHVAADMFRAAERAAAAERLGSVITGLAGHLRDTASLARAAEAKAHAELGDLLHRRAMGQDIGIGGEQE